MSKYVNELEFKQWVKNYYREASAQYNLMAYSFGAKNKKQHGIIIINKDNGKIARSYCHPGDEWDWETGLAVAYARYMGIEVPKVDKSFFIEDLVGKEVKLPPSHSDVPTIVFVTPYKKGGYQVVVNRFTGLSFKVHPQMLIREHDIKDIED